VRRAEPELPARGLQLPEGHAFPGAGSTEVVLGAVQLLADAVQLEVERVDLGEHLVRLRLLLLEAGRRAAAGRRGRQRSEEGDPDQDRRTPEDERTRPHATHFAAG